MDGLGLHVHIRTKIEKKFSYIEAAAVKIGDEVFEVIGGQDNERTYYLNGEKEPAMPTTMSSQSFKIVETNNHQMHSYDIILSDEFKVFSMKA